jgi:hypothetical protein
MTISVIRVMGARTFSGELLIDSFVQIDSFLSSDRSGNGLMDWPEDCCLLAVEDGVDGRLLSGRATSVLFTI